MQSSIVCLRCAKRVPAKETHGSICFTCRPAPPPIKPKLLLKDVTITLANVGITIARQWGEYKVRVKNSPKGHGYFTSDLADALSTGLIMAQEHNAQHTNPNPPTNVPQVSPPSL